MFTASNKIQNPKKTPKNPAGWAFFKNLGFSEPWNAAFLAGLIVCCEKRCWSVIGFCQLHGRYHGDISDQRPHHSC